MKLYMFRTVSLSIIRSYSVHTQQWHMSYSFVDSFFIKIYCQKIRMHIGTKSYKIVPLTNLLELSFAGRV
jgi:hypothetical protein